MAKSPTNGCQETQSGESEERRDRLSFGDVLLIIGTTLLMMGLIIGLIHHQKYSAGMPPLLVNSRFGTQYQKATHPGHARDKANVNYGYSLASVGLLIIGAVIISKWVRKSFKSLETSVKDSSSHKP